MQKYTKGSEDAAGMMALTRTWPCGHPPLRLPASSPGRSKCFLCKPLGGCNLLWQPKLSKVSGIAANTIGSNTGSFPKSVVLRVGTTDFGILLDNSASKRKSISSLYFLVFLPWQGSVLSHQVPLLPALSSKAGQRKSLGTPSSPPSLKEPLATLRSYALTFQRVARCKRCSLGLCGVHLGASAGSEAPQPMAQGTRSLAAACRGLTHLCGGAGLGVARVKPAEFIRLQQTSTWPLEGKALNRLGT